MTDALLAIDDLGDDLEAVLRWPSNSAALEKRRRSRPEFHAAGHPHRGLHLRKPSTRTRVSFEVTDRLGGNPLTLLKNDIQLGTSETVSDTAKVLSRFLITYRCYAHAMPELAESADVPVINALSDKHHPAKPRPTMTVMEAFDTDEKLRVSWVGDGNNVLHDLMLASVMLGHDVAYAVPKGYEPAEDVVARAHAIAEKTGATITATNDPVEAVSGSTSSTPTSSCPWVKSTSTGR